MNSDSYTQSSGKSLYNMKQKRDCIFFDDRCFGSILQYFLLALTIQLAQIKD